MHNSFGLVGKSFFIAKGMVKKEGSSFLGGTYSPAGRSSPPHRTPPSFALRLVLTVEVKHKKTKPLYKMYPLQMKLRDEIGVGWGPNEEFVFVTTGKLGSDFKIRITI